MLNLPLDSLPDGGREYIVTHGPLPRPVDSDFEAVALEAGEPPIAEFLPGEFHRLEAMVGRDVLDDPLNPRERGPKRLSAYAL